MSGWQVSESDTQAEAISMSEAIGVRIEILRHAIATLTECVKVVDDALKSDQSATGRETHRASILELIERIETLAEMQIQLATQFEVTK